MARRIIYVHNVNGSKIKICQLVKKFNIFSIRCRGWRTERRACDCPAARRLRWYVRKHPSLSKFTLRSAFCPKSDNSSEIAYITGFDHSSPVFSAIFKYNSFVWEKKAISTVFNLSIYNIFSDYTLLLSTIYIMISMFRSLFQKFCF